MDNKRGKVTMEYEVTDLPMLVRAFAIARNTAMMGGHGRAADRLEQYRTIIDALVPEAAKVFGEEEFAELGMAFADGPESYVVGYVPDGSRTYDRTGHVAVRIGDRVWRSDRSDYAKGGREIAAVRDLMKEIAPMDAVEVEPDWDGDITLSFSQMDRDDLAGAIEASGKACEGRDSLDREDLLAFVRKELSGWWPEPLAKALRDRVAQKAGGRRRKAHAAASAVE